MLAKKKYKAKDWETLQFVPLWTFYAVAAADGNIDEQEMQCLQKELLEGPLYKCDLAREVLTSLTSNFASLCESFHKDSRHFLVGLSDAKKVLDKKVPKEEAAQFKKAMLMLGRNIADASGQGDFGAGNKIDKNEATALVVIASSLGMAAA